MSSTLEELFDRDSITQIKNIKMEIKKLDEERLEKEKEIKYLKIYFPLIIGIIVIVIPYLCTFNLK